MPRLTGAIRSAASALCPADDDPDLYGGRQGSPGGHGQVGRSEQWPQYKDGLVWDMLGQLGLLLKSEQRSAILPGFSKPWVYMTGVSQSSIYIRTWIAGFHDRYRSGRQAGL